MKDELLWAAAWLYKATGQTSYLNYVSNNQGWSQAVTEFSWDNKFAGAQTLLAKVLVLFRHAKNVFLFNEVTKVMRFLFRNFMVESQIWRSLRGMLTLSYVR